MTHSDILTDVPGTVYLVDSMRHLTSKDKTDN